MGMLTLKYRLTEEEYYNYNYFTAWAAPDKKKYRVRYYLRVLVLYAAVAGLYIFSKSGHNTWTDLTIFSVIGIVYILLVPYLIRRSVLSRVRDILSKPENAHILSDAEITLMNTGIIDKDAVSESKYDWDAIVKKSETADSYYLYTNSYHAIVIPKRVVRDKFERDELERYFNEYLPLDSQ
jgi:hypothetical protein